MGGTSGQVDMLWGRGVSSKTVSQQEGLEVGPGHGCSGVSVEGSRYPNFFFLILAVDWESTASDLELMEHGKVVQCLGGSIGRLKKITTGSQRASPLHHATL